MKIGFWNLNKKELSDLLVSFAIDYELDIICLAETSNNIILDFLKKLNIKTKQKYFQISSLKERIIIISRFSNTVFEDKSCLYKSTRWVTQFISIPKRIAFNLIAVHFHSKVNWSEDSLALECVHLARDIETIESKTNCKETIIIGDFNMDPFEKGLVSANGINALSDLNYSERKRYRNIDGIDYHYFYNPMWNFFGDFAMPYGTYYYRAPGHVSHEWHIYDQVIFRPTLKPYTNNPCVEIVNRISNEQLTSIYNNHRPDKKLYSDHLPIILKLNF